MPYVSQEDEAIEAALQQVNEKHAASSRLADVLASICFVLGVDCAALQDGASGVAPDEEAANDAVDMEDEDEEEEDDGSYEEEEAYDMAEEDDQDRTVSCALPIMHTIERMPFGAALIQ